MNAEFGGLASPSTSVPHPKNRVKALCPCLIIVKIHRQCWKRCWRKNYFLLYDIKTFQQVFKYKITILRQKI